MVEKVHVEVYIVIIVKEGSLGRVPLKCKTIYANTFRKSQVTIVDKQLIPAVKGLLVAHTADKNIQVAVTVDIRHTNACRPVTLSSRAG